MKEEDVQNTRSLGMNQKKYSARLILLAALACNHAVAVTKSATTLGGGVMPAAARDNHVGNISSQSLYARLDTGKGLDVGCYHNVFRRLTSTGDKPDTALYLETGLQKDHRPDRSSGPATGAEQAGE